MHFPPFIGLYRHRVGTLWNFREKFAESRQRKAKGQYARTTVAMPENEEKQPARQELAYEIENRDINDEFTVKF